MLNHLFRLLLAEVFPVLGDVILHLPQSTDYQSPENACKDAIFLIGRFAFHLSHLLFKILVMLCEYFQDGRVFSF